MLPDAKIAYATFGTLNADKSNAILAPSFYGADHRGYAFLIGPGRALDPSTYFIVASEMFANGWSPSPSNTKVPLDGPRFPAIAYRDNVGAAHRLLTRELGVTRLRAVVGFSVERSRRSSGRSVIQTSSIRSYPAEHRRGVPAWRRPARERHQRA